MTSATRINRHGRPASFLDRLAASMSNRRLPVVYHSDDFSIDEITYEVRVFVLYRVEDLTGYSGCGVVADGVVWPDERVTIRWCVAGKAKSTTDFDSIADLINIHGHDGATHVVYLNLNHPVGSTSERQ